PGFGQFTAIARALCLADWSIAGLAALGLHALLEEGDLGKAVARGALVGAGVLLLALAAAFGLAWLATPPPGQPSEFHAHLPQVGVEAAMAVVWLAAAVGLAWLAGRRALTAPMVGLLAAGLVAADLFTFGAGFNPAADPALIERKTPEIEALAAVKEPYRFFSYGRPDHPAPFRDRMSPNLPSVFGIADLNGSDSFFPLRY